MNKRTFLSLFLLLLLVGTVSAQTCADAGFIGTYKKGQAIVFTQTCPTCTFINISLQSPSSAVLFENQEMTLSGGIFSFSIGSGNISTLGLYYVQGYSNLDDPFVACFEVNDSGIQGDNLLMNFLIIFLFTVASFWMIFAFNESRNTIDRADGNFVYYYLGAFMLFSVGIYTILFGFAGYKNLLTEAFGWITWGSGLFFITRPYYVGGKWKW